MLHRNLLILLKFLTVTFCTKVPLPLGRAGQAITTTKSTCRRNHARDLQHCAAVTICTIAIVHVAPRETLKGAECLKPLTKES
jgi:hypothetical protein